MRRLPLGRADEFHGVRLLRTVGDPGPPRLFQEGSSGATGRNGAAMLARLPAGTPEDPCPRLRVLFRLPNPGDFRVDPNFYVVPVQVDGAARDQRPAAPARGTPMPRPEIR